MRKPVLLLLLSSLLVPTWIGARGAQTADEIVEKHLAAQGGRGTLAKLTSQRSTGLVTISAGGAEFSGPIEISQKAPNKVRAYMELDLSALGGPAKMVVEQRFDGTAGWTINEQQGTVPISGDQLESMKNDTFPSPLLDYKATGTRVEVQPKQSIDGKDAIVLLVTPKSGPATRIFLDPQTYLAVRTVSRINSPELGGEVDQTTDVSDYRTVQGFKVPFLSMMSNAAQTITVKIDKVEINVPLDDAIFTVKGDR